MTKIAVMGAGSWGTTVAKVIADGAYDLVICGTESTDARMSVVPAMISARLGWAQRSYEHR